VLVIAAAGNTSGNTSDPTQGSGPTYPAAWELEAAPACVACPAGAACPLVYSVGGVDGADNPLANARPLARPQLTAPAFAVPGIKAVAGVDTVVGPFTGTSVAAAAVSAAAAMVWLQNGAADPRQVMAGLYSTGVDLGVAADFCASASCPSIHRIALCSALQAGGLANLVCDPPAAGMGDNASATAFQSDIASLASVSFDGLSLTGTVTACGDPVFVDAAATAVTAVSACPLEQLPTDLRNVAIDPQPGPDPCPACHAAVNEKSDPIILELLINEELRSAVYAQVLTLLGDAGNVVARYDLAEATGGIAMTAGEAYEVVLAGNGLEYKVGYTTMMVEWLDATERTTKLSQLIVSTP